MNRKLPVLVSGVAAVFTLLLASSTASAQTTADTTFDVTLTVENSCAIAVDNLEFGPVNDLTPVITGAATGTVTCTAAAPVAVSFNVGTGGGTYATRLMANGANTIEYNLYSTAGATAVLGDGTASTVTIGITSTGSPDPFDVFGATVAAQNPKPLGLYSSTVIATVTF